MSKSMCALPYTTLHCNFTIIDFNFCRLRLRVLTIVPGTVCMIANSKVLPNRVFTEKERTERKKNVPNNLWKERKKKKD